MLLENRIINLPDEARTEIIEEIETLIEKKKQEVHTKGQNEKTAMDVLRNQSRGRHELQEKWGTHPDTTDGSINPDEDV